MKYLAIDYGLKRVGIAVTDPEGSIAFPRQTLRKDSKDQYFSDIARIIETEAPDAIVVGLPVNTLGADTLITTQTRNMVQSLKRRIPLPIFWMEEVLSSYEAENDLQRVGLRGKAMKAVLDQQAAIRILETFLVLADTQRKFA